MHQQWCPMQAHPQTVAWICYYMQLDLRCVYSIILSTISCFIQMEVCGKEFFVGVFLGGGSQISSLIIHFYPLTLKYYCTIDFTILQYTHFTTSQYTFVAVHHVLTIVPVNYIGFSFSDLIPYLNIIIRTGIKILPLLWLLGFISVCKICMQVSGRSEGEGMANARMMYVACLLQY